MAEMTTSFSPNDRFSEAAIFGRVVESSGELSPELAEHVLSLRFSDDDELRLRELLAKNANGEISEGEKAELENANHIADLLSLWKSRARRALNPS